MKKKVVEKSVEQLTEQLQKFNDRCVQATLAYDANSGYILFSSFKLLGSDKLAILDSKTLTVVSIVDIPVFNSLKDGEVEVIKYFPDLEHSHAIATPAPYLVSGGEKTVLVRSRLVANSILPSLMVNEHGNFVQIHVSNQGDSSDSSDSNDDEIVARVENTAKLQDFTSETIIPECPLTLRDIEVTRLLYKSSDNAKAVIINVEDYLKTRRSAADKKGDNMYNENTFKCEGTLLVHYKLPYINKASSGEYYRSANYNKCNDHVYCVVIKNGYQSVENDLTSKYFYPFSSQLLLRAWQNIIKARTVIEVQCIFLSMKTENASITTLHCCRLDSIEDNYEVSLIDFDKKNKLIFPHLKQILNCSCNGETLHLGLVHNYHKQCMTKKEAPIDIMTNFAYNCNVYTFNVESGKRFEASSPNVKVLPSTFSTCYDIQNNCIWGIKNNCEIYFTRNYAMAPKIYREIGGSCDYEHIKDGSSFSLNPRKRLRWCRRDIYNSENFASSIFNLVEIIAEPFVPSFVSLNPDAQGAIENSSINQNMGIVLQSGTKISTSLNKKLEKEYGDSSITICGDVLYDSKALSAKENENEREEMFDDFAWQKLADK